MKKLSVFLLVVVLTVCTMLFACSPKEAASTEAPTAAPTAATATDAPKTDGATEKPADTGTAEVPVTYQQSPFFDSRSDLPPVAERLPEVPKVVKEIKPEFYAGGAMEIGQYGGTLRMVNPSVDWNPDIFLACNEGLLHTPSLLGEEVLGNVLESYEVSDDEKEFTFKMRKGLKWSDGVPVTMDDVKFGIEDCQFNTDLNAAGPEGRYCAGGTNANAPMKFEVIDDWTFKLSFEKPYGRFLIQIGLQGWVGYTGLIRPKHYLTKYHLSYSDAETLQKLAEEAGETDPSQWINLFNRMDVLNWDLCNKEAVGFPSLYPWIQVSNDGTTKLYERNPYYFKVDAAGNQLPYIDKVQGTYVQDIEMVNMKLLAGEVDFLREDAALSKMPLYRENGPRNGFDAPLLNQHVDACIFHFNQTLLDPTKRATFQNADFRKAVALGVDYNEILQTLYFGYAEPSVLQPTTYDVAEANKLLDGIGMVKGADGIRTGVDGKPLAIQMEVAPDALEMPEAANIFATEMTEVLGVKVTSKTVEGALRDQRRNANELEGTVNWEHVPLWRTGGWFEWREFNNDGQLWHLWITQNGNAGEEPPEWVKRIDEIYQTGVIESVPGTPESEAAFDEVFKIYNEQMPRWAVGHNFKQPLLASTKLGNIPVDGIAVAVDIALETLFFKQ